MKQISYCLFIHVLLSVISMRAMENPGDQLLGWADRINNIDQRLQNVIPQLPSMTNNALEKMSGEMFQAPEALKDLSTDLREIYNEMCVISKMPIIQADIIERTKDLFEREIKYLRPERPSDGGRDRSYIKKYLHELFEGVDMKNQRFDQIPPEKTPYIPAIIDHMLAKRYHNEGARITLERAKLASEFKPESLSAKIMDSWIKVNLKDVSENTAKNLTEKISKELNIRYFAIKGVYEWMKSQGGDDPVIEESNQGAQVSQKKSKKRSSDDLDYDIVE